MFYLHENEYVICTLSMINLFRRSPFRMCLTLNYLSLGRRRVQGKLSRQQTKDLTGLFFYSPPQIGKLLFHLLALISPIQRGISIKRFKVHRERQT